MTDNFESDLQIKEYGNIHQHVLNNALFFKKWFVKVVYEKHFSAHPTTARE